MIMEEKIPLLRLLSDYFKQKKYNYVLIGANVPLILIEFKQPDGRGFGIEPTKDVDFSVIVKDWDDYRNLKSDLLNIGLIQKEQEPEHRFFYNDLMVDIIPYNPAIVKNGYLEWPGSGFSMNVTGFDILFKHTIEEWIAEDLEIPVIPLPLLVFTKMSAYLDRKAVRDLQDVLYVLEHYEEASISERRFDVLPDEEINYENSGALLLGLDLKPLLSESELGIVYEFLDLFKDEYTEAVQKLARASRKNVEEIIELVRVFKRGITG
jgi:predicted nucleotidyltransferase